jgi:tRNA U38,U39,U40 pseudouridine synthase TruA
MPSMEENMTDITNNQLQSVIERIERMEVEKAAVAEDIKQIYLEAKGNGFDTKIIRKVIALRKRTVEEREAERAMIELYLGQLSDTPLGRFVLQSRE